MSGVVKIEAEIQEIVDRETKAWSEKSTKLLLSIFHPDMVWFWPTDAKKLDPMTWTTLHGKFEYQRWEKTYTQWFQDFEVVRNIRKTKKIILTREGDGAFAVVDIDTLWVKSTGEESH